jgi:Type II secretion system (T2SS), protein E, N-terminal domain
MSAANGRGFSSVRAETGHFASFPGGMAPIHEIGLEGVTLEETQAMRFDTVVRLRLHLGADFVECTGKVKGSDPETGVVKIQFEDLTTVARKRLTTYLVQSKIRENRQGTSARSNSGAQDKGELPRPRSLPVSAAGYSTLAVALLRRSVVDADRLAVATAHQREHGGLLPLILVSFQVISEDDLAVFIHREYRLPIVDLSTVEPTIEALRLVPLAIALRHVILPVGVAGSTLTVAVADPLNTDGLAAVKFRSGCALRVAIAPARSLLTAINRFYEERTRETG